MADYISKSARLTTTLAPIYTCPTGKKALVMLASVTNVTTSTQNVSAAWGDTSAGSTAYLAFNLPIPAAASVRLLEDRLILKAGDTLQLRASVANALDVVISVTEL